ncbi:glycine betaine ABC transporter substrate-binding protein [Trueperella pecoris]|uniref:glycine betaine ABC transporter substrate-binding protein n=1 Tax=Trueperella pecoris TaxID=2733571 RepID=UPI001ABDF1DD|nr:glycine betaine ABC transporter substrate-binding protein [Trueperella pecoris]QTG75159.1 hypothetical protein J4179_08020 [Trueperella pecoris]
MPEGLQLLDQAEATDQDSYVVTRAFSEENGITSLADLAGVCGQTYRRRQLRIRKPAERPKGLKKFYDVEVGFTPIQDKGGPLTIKALKDGEIQLADIFSASPAIKRNDIVVLGDPKGMFLSSHVAPLASAILDPAAVKVINAVQSKLTAASLVALNVKSFQDQQPVATIAANWIKNN